MLEEYHDVLDTADICTILRIGRKTAYQLLNSGEIPCKRIGRKYKISKASLIEYLQKK